ncbi:MAG: outer membrane insertion C- signal [Bacteroidales bacterium]|nr:outer membrane insertion C- signal [Bacteroidales bacterium]
MKKLLLISIFALIAVYYAGAQEIGVRFGGTNGAGGVALDGVFGAGPGRIHADLGIYNGGVGVDVLWDFIYKPLGGEAFNWYLGAGPTTYIGDDFWLGVCGEIGLEYRFNSVPISLGVDWRPTLWVIEETKFGADSFGLCARFRFGK